VVLFVVGGGGGGGWGTPPKEYLNLILIISNAC